MTAIPAPIGAHFVYEPVSAAAMPLTVRLGAYPREPHAVLDALRAAGRRLTAGLVRLLYRVEVVGAPPDLARVALVSNHRSHLDTLAILAALPERQRRRVAAFAARDYFFDRPSRALAASLLGQGIAFDRNDVSELRRWAKLLPRLDGGWFVAYPSGSRRSRELHGGLVSILARGGWPIVPVHVSGTAEAWPPGSRLPRPFRGLRVTFGEPITASTHEALLPTLARFVEGSDDA